MKYKCLHCNKEVERDSNKKYINSYCSETGRDVRLIPVVPIDKTQIV